MKPATISGIYQITCSATGYRYIGSAMDAARRWSQHQSRAARGVHDNIHLQRAWNKYGSTAFTFEVVEVVSDVTKLIEVEQRWIDMYSPELNICRTAGSVLGAKRSPEARARISAASRGRVTSEETKQKLSYANKGRSTSEETRKKLSESNLGRQRTPEQNKRNSDARIGRPLAAETRAKLSEALKGRPKSDETKAKLSAAHKGRKRKPMSEDHKRRISETLRATKLAAKQAPQTDAFSPQPQ